jgi:hypothetical protein
MITIIPGFLEDSLARCMATYDEQMAAHVAAEPDAEMQRMVAAAAKLARPRVEALIRKRNAEEFGKAVLALVEQEGEAH